MILTGEIAQAAKTAIAAIDPGATVYLHAFPSDGTKPCFVAAVPEIKRTAGMKGMLEAAAKVVITSIPAENAAGEPDMESLTGLQRKALAAFCGCRIDTPKGALPITAITEKRTGQQGETELVLAYYDDDIDDLYFEQQPEAEAMGNITVNMKAGEGHGA